MTAADTTDTTAPAVALVGCGYWGRNLLRNLAELGALKAVSDLDEATAQAASDSTGAAILTLDEILASPEIEGVVFATPAITHAELATRALEAGKHVFVEKPLALDLVSAEAVCALAEARDLVLMVGHLLQYHPAFLRLRQLVDAGDLGRLQYVYSNRLNLGKVRREENIWWSFAPHDISMILSLLRQEPENVTATGSFFLHDSIADVTTTQMAFPGGQRAHIFVSWLHPMKEQRLVVIGDRGMAVFDDGRPWEEKLVIYRHGLHWIDGQPELSRADAEPVPIVQREPLRDECQHFLDCITTGAPPRTNGREGLRVLRVLASAEAAMRSGPAEEQLHVADRHTGSSADAFVHESSYVDDDVSIGTGTRIWHFSHVLSGTTIGEHCNIGQNVVIGPDVEVGRNCKIQNNVSVYKGVTLEDGVFCGPSCVFTNVNNPRADVSRTDEFRPTVVRRGATIGANATIVCGHEIGEYAFVAAGAVVADDVVPHALVAGVPARRIGWMSHDGERLDESLTCPRSGRRYELDGAGNLKESTHGRT